MPNVGPTELIILLVLALIIFGPGKLPGLGASLGKSIKEFRQGVREVTGEGQAEEGSAEGEARPAKEA